MAKKKEVIVCTVDGVERKILTKSIRLDLDMEHIYLKKLKIHKDNIVRIKKVQSEKDKWIRFTLSNKMKNEEKVIIVGEDYQVTGRVVGFDENEALIECVGFSALVSINLSNIKSIY